MARNRGRAMLLAQRQATHMNLPPLGAPPAHLSPAAVTAWHDIVREAPPLLTDADALSLELIAVLLEGWRAGLHERDRMLELYRWLGQYFVPMAARRRLLFSERTSRGSRG